MSAKEVGKKLVAFCKEGKNLEAINELYADNIESIESIVGYNGERVAKGIEAIRAKYKWWIDNHEIHSEEVGGPWPHGDEKFAAHFKYDLTNKPSGQRIKVDEIAVYTLEDGKIVKEEFMG